MRNLSKAIPRTAVFPACLALVSAGPSDATAWPPPVISVAASEQNAHFPTPNALKPAVTFWREVFERYDSHQVVLHDREDMELVWQVVNLPVDGEGTLDEEAADELVRRSVEHLQARLRRLAHDTTPTDPHDVIILASAGANDPNRLRGACNRVRAQRGVADKLREGLVRSDRWLPSVRRILMEEEVPPELVALTFVESMFNPRARSAAGAAGVWQLMPSTARWLGLTVRRGADERLDVLKATRAAAHMLRKSYRMLGSWPLALTAYNHGPYGVRRAVEQTGSSDLAYLIQHYRKPTWGFASKNFYAEFLAVLQILTDRPDVGESQARTRAAL